MNHFILFSQLKRFLNESSHTLKLGLPVIVAQLLQTLMQFVDTVMAGHVSSKDLAGLAIATALYHPVFLLMLGILIALGSIIAQLFGAVKPAEIVTNVIQGLWLSQVLALVSIVILANPEPVLHFMGYEAKVIQVAGDYLRALCWGMPAVYAYIVLRMFNEGLSITRPNMYFSLIWTGNQYRRKLYTHVWSLRFSCPWSSWCRMDNKHGALGYVQCYACILFKRLTV